MALAAEKLKLVREPREKNDSPKPKFRTIEGGNLDAKAEQGVHPLAFKAFTLCLKLILVIFVAGTLTVTMNALTVQKLIENQRLESEISQLEDERELLAIEMTNYSNSRRISNIAEHLYGMVKVVPNESINVEDHFNEE